MTGARTLQRSAPFKQQPVPEHIKDCIDDGPYQVGCDEVGKFDLPGTVIPHHQESPEGNGKQKRCGHSDPQKSVTLFDPDDPAVSSGKDLLVTVAITGRGPLLSEGSVPPGNKLF